MSNLFFDHRWCAPHGIGRFASELRRRLSGFADLPLGGSPTSPLDPLRLAAGLHQNGAAGLFSPGFNVPLRPPCPVVVTIHDLIHVHFAAESSRLKTAYYRYIQRPIVRRSPITLTVSEFSRQQIIDWYDVPEERVVSVGNGVSDAFKSEGSKVYSDQPYFLYVGNAKPHKNVGTLLAATALLRRVHDVRCKLITNATRRLREQIASFSLQDHVDVIGHVDDRVLAEYYRGAIGLVLPSRFEGFGLPLVEAMACGCPVIASNRTSIPEVVGSAGVLFDPDDCEALVASMSDLLEKQALRQRLISRGLERSQLYRWNTVASRVRIALGTAFQGAELDLGLSENAERDPGDEVRGPTPQLRMNQIATGSNGANDLAGV